MKSFLDWAKENNTRVIEIISEPEGKLADENTKRTGLSHNYPDAYIRGQYPHKYFNPITSTADLDQEAKPRKG